MSGWPAPETADSGSVQASDAASAAGGASGPELSRCGEVLTA